MLNLMKINYIFILMVIQYLCLSMLLILCGHFIYEYHIKYYKQPKQLNIYNNINKEYLKVADDLSNEQYNRDKMKTDLKEYIKTCV